MGISHPVDPHIDHKVVVGLEGLLAHWTVLSFPGYSWNLVGDLRNLPSLSTLRKVFPMKKGGHLLLYSFQHPLLYQHFILSRTDLGWNLYGSRSTNLCLAPPVQVPDQQLHPHWIAQQLDPPQCLRDDHISTMRWPTQNTPTLTSADLCQLELKWEKTSNTKTLGQ